MWVSYCCLQDVVFGFRCSRLVASRTQMGPRAEILQAAQTAGIEACAQLEGAQTETASALQLCDAETLQGEPVPTVQRLALRAGPSPLPMAGPGPSSHCHHCLKSPSDASSPGMERLLSVFAALLFKLTACMFS